MNTQNFSQLLVNDCPMMDVRAPIEFQRGAFPTATNLPLLDDRERDLVGKCYKQQGQNRAIAKGHELVSGQIRDARIAAWVEFAGQHPDASLYCFRGGLRSEVAQRWMREAGVELPRIEGGYKALRTFLINELESAALECTFRLVGGKTGSAKTVLINELDNAVDLEGAANHRGSSFGRHAKEQNSQINFENTLAIDFLKLRHRNISDIVLEDEARSIGKVGLPKSLFTKMRASQIIVIEEPIEARLQRLIQEYVVDMKLEFEAQQASNGFEAFSSYLLLGLEKIRKRLGSANYEAARKAMQQALKQHLRSGDITNHYDWLNILLQNYYDPLYTYELSKREAYVCFRGDYQACREYLQSTA